MSGMSSILAGVLPYINSPDVSITSISGGSPQLTPDTTASDVFEKGYWWKNRTAAGNNVASGLKRCSCNNCQACAARYYIEQGRISSSEPGPEESPDPSESKNSQGKKAQPSAATSTEQETGGMTNRSSPPHFITNHLIARS